MVDKEDVSHDYHFWEGEPSLIHKRIIAPDGKKFRYYDDKGIFNFVFFIWMYKWAKTATKKYLDPYMLHPVPLADQITIWQPILSRHISDGIASVEAYESLGDKNAKKPVKYILARAVLLTFWKRVLFVLIGVTIMNAFGMSASILLHRLLHLLSEDSFKFVTFFGLAISIVIMEMIKIIGMSHLEYCVERLLLITDASIRLTIFQHGLCYRRSQFGNFHSKEGSCKSLIHGCSGENVCTDDPLLCPARRYKNNEVTPQMYAFVLNDARQIPFPIEFLSGFVDFLTAFIYGIVIMISQFNVKALTILIVSLSLVVCMIVVEIINGFFMKYYLGIRDNRIAKSDEVISGLHLIERMALDDVGHDIITETRNDELVFVVIRFFISLINKVIMTSIMCINIIVLINDFMSQVKDANDVKSVNPSELLASIFIIMKVVGPLYMIPIRLKFLIFSFVAFRRLESFFRTCSPNFYLPDNKFTGKVSLPEALPDKDKSIPKGLLVMFENASFAWVNSRKELMDKTGITCLRNINFVLNTGNLAIVTGAHGSGKTNFVKAILGDMTLVDGSMAVLPLSTNMPIFYAPQDVFLQKGTIRSNITFGHKFDEDLYRMVIKAMELEHDISTWEEGDLRTILEHGYSLSGGQRVRVGLARAVYAYLIYSKVSREEGSKCSFLIVIDDSFTGLDPFVAKTIFKNLFSPNGLLAKDDVSVVLTISKRILDVCISSELSSSFFDATIYSLRNKTLVQMNSLKSLIDNEVGHLEPPTPSVDRMRFPRRSHEMLKRCNSDDYTKSGRKRSTMAKYAESPTVQNMYKRNETGGCKSESFKPYGAYLHAAGWPILLFIILALIFATLDNTKLVITSKICDSISGYIKGDGRRVVSVESVREYSVKASIWVIILSTSVMVGTFFSIITMTCASFNVSRRTHDYSVNSIFVNSSTVIKIKKSLSSILTFLYIDTLYIDNFLSYLINDAFLFLIEAAVHMLTLFFIMPWSTPLVIILGFISFEFILYYYIMSSENVAFAQLEVFNQMDSVIETAISGSPIYRGFKKEWELVHNMAECADYSARCTNFAYAVIFWASISLRCLLLPLALFILLFPLLRSRYFGVEVKVGYYAMAYSIFLSVNDMAANFLRLYFYLQLTLTPMRRFVHFVPLNTSLKFDKRRDIDQTDVIVDYSGSHEGDKISDENIKDSIRTRRRKEYAERRATTCTSLRTLLFKHSVNVLDVSKYASPEHVRVQLNNVNVYVSSKTSQGKHAILKNVTCSANVSDFVGIIGRTGAGKTTLLLVLQNLVANRDGSVLLDGCDLRDMPQNVTRQVIGVLPQLPFVFRGWTVRRFIDPRMLFDDVDIELALENCGLLKFVENLPGSKGLDTIILPDHYHRDMPKYYKRVYYGPTLRPYNDSSIDNINVDYGAALSHSQLRTLSVARLVLYRDFFKVLLVDEPPEGECETAYSDTIRIPIYKLIWTYFKHCTTFIAAHDASVLRLCTSVWAFHNGSLIKTCKTEDIADSSSLSKIIEDCIAQHT